MAQYAVVVDKRGSCYRAYVPDMPGVTATGSSLAAAEQALRDRLMALNADPVGMAATEVGLDAARSGDYVRVMPTL